MSDDTWYRSGGPAAPWWAKLSTISALTLIAMGLVYRMASIQDADIRNIRENLLLHHQDAQVMHQQIERYMEIQNGLTRQLCVNAASTRDERDGCLKP